MDVKVDLVHYNTAYKAPAGKLRWFQTLVYCRIDDGRKGIKNLPADFRIVIEPGKETVDIGKKLAEELRIKTTIIGECRKRIAAYKKKLQAGKTVSDHDHFIARRDDVWKSNRR